MSFDFKIKNNITVIFCTVLTAVVYVFYAQIQPTYTYSLTDPRLDAHQYTAQYDYFRGTTKNYEVRFPFNARILSSCLAAQLSFGDIITNFKILNGIFLVFMALFLSLLWQRLQIRNSFIIIGLSWLLFHWKGPVRMYLPDPITADVGGYFFGAAWLWILSNHKPNKILLCAVAVLATLQKEVFILVIGLLVVSDWLLVFGRESLNNNNQNLNFKTSSAYLLYVFAFAIMVHFAADYFYAASNPNWRNFSVVSVLRGVQRYVLSPELFLRLPVSWFLAFGGFQLSFFSYQLSFKNKKKHNPHLTTHISHLTSIFFVLSIFAGGDTSRILMTGAPFVMTFLLLKLNQMPDWVGYFAAATSLPLMRLTTLEPDLGLYPGQAHDWCVERWPLAESWPYLAYVLVVGVVFWFLVSKNLNLRTAKQEQNL